MRTMKREKRKDEQIKYLQKRVCFLENKNIEIEQQTERQEHYSKGNCFLIHGVEERRHENTDELNQTIKSEMDTNIDVKNIDRAHRIVAKT